VLTLRRYRIGTRLGVSLTLVLLVLVVVIGVGISSMARIDRAMADVVTTTSARIANAVTIRDATHHEERAVLNTLAGPVASSRSFDRVRVVTARATRRDALAELEALGRVHAGTDRAGELAELAKAIYEAERSADEVMALARDGRTDQAVRVYGSSTRLCMLELQNLSAGLVATLEAERDSRYAEARATYVFTRGAFVGISMLGVALAVVVGALLTRSINEPLRRGVLVANRLAEGKPYTCTVPSETNWGAGDPDGKKLTEGLLNHIEVAVRAFDPCLSCATHALGKMPLQVELMDAGGNVVAVRSKE
jgi:hypothetical protein